MDSKARFHYLKLPKGRPAEIWEKSPQYPKNSRQIVNSEKNSRAVGHELESWLKEYLAKNQEGRQPAVNACIPPHDASHPVIVY
jgi:hypothetical protein